MKKLKKILSVVSAAVLCTVPFAGSISSSAAVSRNTYRYYVDVEKNSGIASCDLELRYWDNMTFVKEKIGNLGGELIAYEAGGQGIGDGTQKQYVECHYKNSGNLVSKGTLFTMKFWSVNDFESNIDTNLHEIRLKDINGKTINNTGEKFAKSKIVLVGDANGDSNVDMSDAVMIMQFVSNPSNFQDINGYAADVNNDGVITDDDATLIQQYCLEIIDHF